MKKISGLPDEGEDWQAAPRRYTWWKLCSRYTLAFCLASCEAALAFLAISLRRLADSFELRLLLLLLHAGQVSTTWG